MTTETYPCITTLIVNLAENLRVKVEFDVEELVEPKVVRDREYYYAWQKPNEMSVSFFETSEDLRKALVRSLPEVLQAASQTKPDFETSYPDEDF